MKWKGYLGFLFIVIGFVLTIVSMATLEWMAIGYDDGDCYYGLAQKRCCDKDGSSCTTSSLDGDSDIKSGGQRVFGVAIPSLFIAVVGAVLVYIAQRKRAPGYRRLAIVAWMIAGVLNILAVVLYSKKTVHLDYAFILYLFSSFSALIGCCVILFGPGVGEVA